MSSFGCQWFCHGSETIHFFFFFFSVPIFFLYIKDVWIAASFLVFFLLFDQKEEQTKHMFLRCFTVSQNIHKRVTDKLIISGLICFDDMSARAMKLMMFFVHCFDSVFTCNSSR